MLDPYIILQNVYLAQLALSLGGVQTQVLHPASMTAGANIKSTTKKCCCVANTDNLVRIRYVPFHYNPGIRSVRGYIVFVFSVTMFVSVC